VSVPGKISSDILILGLGNVLLRDEGVGVHVVNQLLEQYLFNSSVEIIDGGTSGLDLLGDIEGRARIIIVDAIEFGQYPGYIGLLKHDEILARIQTKLSIHHLGLSDILSTLILLDKIPSEIVLVGIQPEMLETGLVLSEAVNEVIPKVIKVIFSQLKKWGVTAKQSTIKNQTVNGPHCLGHILI